MAQTLSDYPVSDEAFNLRDTMVGLLASVNTIFDSYNVPLPTRQYWTMEQPVEDCPQVVVWLLQTYLGVPGDQASAPQRCTGPRSIVVNIDITRSYPVGENGKAVSPERIMQAAEWSAVDTQVLLDSLSDFDLAGAGVIATVAPQRPQGGLQTVRLNISLLAT
jgi:hypothetical protein